MSTVSIPLQGGNIADGAIEARHIADGAVGLSQLATMPRREVFNVSGVLAFGSRKEFKWKLGTHHHGLALLSIEPTMADGFSTLPASPLYSSSAASQVVFGRRAYASAFTRQYSASQSVQPVALPVSLVITTDYRAAMLNAGNTGNATSPFMPTQIGIGQTYADGAGAVFGYYSIEEAASLFNPSSAGSKLILESAWLEDPDVLVLAVKSLGTPGSNVSLFARAHVMY